MSADAPLVSTPAAGTVAVSVPATGVAVVQGHLFRHASFSAETVKVLVGAEALNLNDPAAPTPPPHALAPGEFEIVDGTSLAPPVLLDDATRPFVIRLCFPVPHLASGDDPAIANHGQRRRERPTLDSCAMTTAAAKRPRTASAPRPDAAGNGCRPRRRRGAGAAPFPAPGTAARRRGWQQLWSEAGAPGANGATLQREVAAILDDRDSPEAEARWHGRREGGGTWNPALAEIEAALAIYPDSRWGRFGQTFGLLPADLDLLQACAAVAWDPSLGRVAAYLQVHAGHGFMTLELAAARLYGHGRGRVWFAGVAGFSVGVAAPARAPGRRAGGVGVRSANSRMAARAGIAG